MELVITEDREAVRHIVLNRPEKRNAFNGDLVAAVGRTLRAAADDPAVHCVVLRGEGPVFSAGMDLGSLAGLAGAGVPEPAADGEAVVQRPVQAGPQVVSGRLRAFRRACIEAWNLAEEMAKPTVCQIHGACIGGAMELALACDLRVMAADAVIGVPETRIGLIPDVGGSSRLPQLVGLGRAKELVLTGKMIGAEEAERIGLVNRVVPPEELAAATETLVGELLACSPLAVGLAKRVLDASARPALSTTLELEVAMQEVCVRSLPPELTGA
jgi:enoyl-CoA hydratase/carnithine racemase